MVLLLKGLFFPLEMYYSNEMEILDGTQWNVSFVMNGRTYNCSGDNNFPREWTLFCRAINRLVKHNYLE